MLHIKFQENRSTGSRKVFTMNRYGGRIGHVTLTVFPQPKETVYKTLFSIGPERLLRRCLKCHSMRVLAQRSNNEIDLLFS